MFPEDGIKMWATALVVAVAIQRPGCKGEIITKIITGVCSQTWESCYKEGSLTDPQNSLSKLKKSIQ